LNIAIHSGAFSWSEKSGVFHLAWNVFKTNKSMNKPKIYLIGSFHDFRDKIINALPDYDFSDPRKFKQSCVLNTVSEDVKEAKECPVSLAVFPKGKSRGTMSYAELGISAVYENHIIIVDEDENADPLLKQIARNYFTNLDDAIGFLKTKPSFSLNSKKEMVSKYPANSDYKIIPCNTVYVCGTIDEELMEAVERADKRGAEKRVIFNSDTYQDFQNILSYDLIVANFPAKPDMDWDRHACFMMGAAYPHDISVLLIDPHEWKYPPLQGLVRRHATTMNNLEDYLVYVKDLHINNEAVVMYNLFKDEQKRIKENDEEKKRKENENSGTDIF